MVEARSDRRWIRSDPVLISERATFHLTYRLVSRSMQFLASPQLSRRMAAAGFGLFDIAQWRFLKRSAGFALAPRLAADALDGAYWSLQSTSRYDLATLPGVPLAIEAGNRLGVLGIAVPLVNATGAALLRRRHHLPSQLGSFRWQAMAVGLGAGISRYSRRQRHLLRSQLEQQLVAQRRWAYLAGQHDVAMGADNVVDLLCRTAPLVEAHGNEQAIGAMVSAWKRSLAEATQESSVYLGVVLAQWARRHNDFQHDLAADVTFDLAEDAGTIILSA